MNTKDIMDILPNHIFQIILNSGDIKILQEIRIKVNVNLILIYGNREVLTSYILSFTDVNYAFQRISNYSVYAIDEDLRQGYITIRGGHRVGFCGTCVVSDNSITTIREIGSMNIRICREYKGCSNKILELIYCDKKVCNTIIISPPRCGKTTILRDIVRNISDGNKFIDVAGKRVCIIDERSEIAACYRGVPQLEVGIRTDVLDNCPKFYGIMMAIRSMAPDVIVCDEIGSSRDIESVMLALNCGVAVITSIHGYGIEDLQTRSAFSYLVENNVFKKAIVMSSRLGAGTIEYAYDFESKSKRRICDERI